jgi:class 3 adenylate cyclase/tetratricopeptide (TPR) repeat protein
MGISVRELLAMAHRALDKPDWSQVYCRASTVLALEPDNAEAAMLQALAARHGGHAPLPGRRQATALFADLVDSTRLAEHYDVEIYSEVLRAFLAACTPAITRHDGHLVDTQGDGIVACFGYPNAHEDDACRAVSAALDMIGALRRIGAQLQAERGIEPRMRIGIDTGEIMIDRGEISGASLNRASRLQDLATPGGVLVSGRTNQLVDEHFETRSLGRRELRGVDVPVEVFRVLRRRERPVFSALARAPSLPLVGRDAELQHVLDVWNQLVAEDRTAVEGRAAIIHVLGEPGIGKSRLAMEVVARIATAASRVLQLDCSSYTATSTLAPLRSAIERYADLRPDDGDEHRLDKLEAVCADLEADPAEVIPVLATLLSLDLAGRYPPLDVSPTQLQRVVLERLAAMLPVLTREGPAILVIEDMQWADTTMVELVERLADTGLPNGLLILATAREPRWVSGHGSVHTIRLGPLPSAEARELAFAVGPEAMSLSDAVEIAARGDGVPLFVEQLAHAFGEIDVVAGSAKSVPQTLMQLLQARLDTVGPATKLIAQVAATLGREFQVPVLEAVVAGLGDAGKPDGSLERHLKELTKADLVEPMARDGLLRFRHVLIRDAAYRSQLIRDRKIRHGAVAETLAKTGEAALTAFHFEQAERPLDALAHYLHAVRRAQSAGAFDEVLAHLERCDALLAHVPDETTRARFELAVCLNRGLALSSTGGYVAPGVLTDYNRARELCSSLSQVPGVAEELLKVLFAIWNYYCTSGDFDTAETICAAIERQLDRATIRSGRHGLDACRGVGALCRGELRRADELLSRAVNGMLRDGIEPDEWWQPHDPLSASCALLAPVRFLRGDEVGALEAIRTGLERGERLPFPKGPFSVAQVHMYEAIVHWRRHDGPASLAAAGEVIRIGERHGFSDWQLVGQIYLAAAKTVTDETSAALDQMGTAMRIWRAVGSEMLIPALFIGQADGYLARGEPAKATASLEQAFQGMRSGQRLWAAEALRLRAELRLRQEPAARAAAAADLREAIAVARDQGDTYSLLRVALAHHRLLGGVPDGAVDAALAEAVAAYRGAMPFPALIEARELVGASGQLKPG